MQFDAMPPDAFAALLAQISPYDAVTFVGDGVAPVLLQAARFDLGVTEAEYEDFYAACSEPKELRWYDGGHEITDVAAFADRARFLATHLDLPALPGIVAERVTVTQ
jgi:hypothetical protein